MTTEQQQAIDKTPTDDLTMAQMQMIGETLDFIETDDDVLGELMADIEMYQE